MRIAMYARVLTDKQDTENQLLQLREFANRQGWTVVREYCDYESGSKADRTQFQQLLVDASKSKFDLLFWALDRLTREGALTGSKVTKSASSRLPSRILTLAASSKKPWSASSLLSPNRSGCHSLQN